MDSLSPTVFLSGPDTVSDDSSSTDATPASYTGMLSGEDESIARYTPVTGAALVGTAYTGVEELTGIGTDSDTHVTSKVTVGSHIYTGIESGPAVAGGLVYSPFDPKSPYYFMGSMSQEVMHLYLDKKLQMSQVCHYYCSGGWGGTGAESDDQFNDLLNMIIDIRPKFVNDMMADDGWTMNLPIDPYTHLPSGRWNLINDRLIPAAIKLHTFDPEMILEGCISEFVQGGVNAILIPPDIIPLFSVPPLSPGEVRYFDVNNIALLNIDGKPNMTKSGGWSPVVSIIRPEAQMWFYYLATIFIDCGYESVHFGDIPTITTDAGNILVDHGFQQLWGVLSMIRSYAKTHARRGVVLMDSHVFGPGINSIKINSGSYYPGYDYSALAYYFDPHPETPLPNWQRQLLFDSHTLGVFYSEPADWLSYCKFYPYDYPRSNASGNLPLELLSYFGEGQNGLLTNSLGGLNPQGWYCAHNPVCIRFDYGGNSTEVGCFSPLTSYGYENTSWYILNSEAFRNAISIYTYYRAKCLDANAHFALPGRLESSFPPEYVGCGSMYNALFPPEGIAASPEYGSNWPTLAAIFANAYAGSENWILHNFTFEGVSNGTNDVSSGLVFVGVDKIFYIGSDGWINGYVHIYDTWVTVSPSAAAHETGQVQAQSDLVASPDGSMLLYIGVDGYIHGFYIRDIWTYTYIDFMKWETGAMLDQKIIADSCLIFPFDDRIYYISTYTPTGAKFIQGFQKSTGVWETVSPSFAAEIIYGWRADAQEPPAGALMYVATQDPNRLYYRGIDGKLYYFLAFSWTDYQYVPCPANATVLAGLDIIGNLALHYDASKNENRFYFVGKAGDGSLWVYFLIDNGSSWGGLSPSCWIGGSPTFAAVPNGYPLSIQVQSIIRGDIAISPDGNTIAYFGMDRSFDGKNWLIQNFVGYYHNIDGTNYGFVKIMTDEYTMPGPYIIIDRLSVPAMNTLQFINNADLYFGFSNAVYHLIYEEDFCNNPWGAYYPEYAYGGT